MEQKRRARKSVIAPKHPTTRKVEDLSKSMSADQLWAFHEKVAATLTAKIAAEIELLEDRLRLLSEGRGIANGETSQETTKPANSTACVEKKD